MLVDLTVKDVDEVTRVSVVNLRGAVVASYPRATDVSPTWSPDGRKLAFVRTSSRPQLYVVDIARRTLRRLAIGSVVARRAVDRLRGGRRGMSRRRGGRRHGRRLDAMGRLRPRLEFAVVA
jgi:dipeptidyl aminopeptidase/acylaminoacyl peptidase